MSLTTEQYLGLSALAYEDFSKVKKNGKDNLIQELVKGSDKPEFKVLSGIANWTLIAQSSSSSGFSAVAFKSPSGEIVFCF